MVIKIKLIKPKIHCSRSFYKTSQIKFQSLSIPPIANLNSRSTQKIIHFNNPWQILDSNQINKLAERLEDKPQELYQVVKQKQNLQKQHFKLKFNKLEQDIDLKFISHDINKIKLKKAKSSLSLGKMSSLSSTNFSKRQNSPKNLLKNLSKMEQKMMENKLMKKIKEKRIEYENELKKMFKDKRLILETDLPKIKNIKAPEQTFSQFKINEIRHKLPVWKLR